MSPAADDSQPPAVVLSWGLRVDSTAILLRWLTEPGARDFGGPRQLALFDDRGKSRLARVYAEVRL